MIYVLLTCFHILISHASEKTKKSMISTSLCLSIALVEVFLLAFHRKTGEPNSMKLKHNLASIPGSDTNQLLFPLYCIYLLKCKCPKVKEIKVFF